MLPRLLLTQGDVAGIGPEIIARAWPELVRQCRPVVVGDPLWMERALQLVGNRSIRIVVVHSAEGVGSLQDVEPDPITLPILHATNQDLSAVKPGQVSASAGRAAYDFLCRAIDLTLAGAAEGIVTAPMHKEGLHRAGISHPGHTEILAERTGTRSFAMVLALGELAVVHVTLHVALRQVFDLITTEAIHAKIHLLHTLQRRLLGRSPRIGVAALNPHAGDGGLFGEEEQQVLVPAVEAARAEGIQVSGPWPVDTLFVRANMGEFDGVVAMYHDQGHIALKLLGWRRAVNISVGLPIVRTSVAHGTAYDIAGRGLADASSLLEAVRVATRLAR